MKRILASMLAVMLMIGTISIVTFGDPTQTLDDVINGNSGGSTVEVQDTQDVQDSGNSNNQVTSNNTSNSPTYNKNQDFINGLNQAGNLTTPNVEGVSEITAGAKTVAAFIVQVLSYCIIIFMAVGILLDLCYIALPFTRSFLANGYTGSAQRDGNGMQGAGGPMGAMGGPMGSMGGMGFGSQMIAQNAMRTQSQMAGQNAMMNRNSSMLGNVQFISYAALNAVASEATIGPDGKTTNPFKIYVKDMTVKLIVVPILIVLAATGVVTQFGFVVADVIVGAIQKVGSMV